MLNVKVPPVESNAVTVSGRTVPADSMSTCRASVSQHSGRCLSSKMFFQRHPYYKDHGMNVKL